MVYSLPTTGVLHCCNTGAANIPYTNLYLYIRYISHCISHLNDGEQEWK